MIVTSLEMASGVTTFVMNYIDELVRQDFTVDVVNLKNMRSADFYKNTEKVKQLGGQVFFLPSIRKPEQYLKACRKIIKTGNYQIVHNNTLLPSLPLMFEAWKQKVPVRILHSHNAQLGETSLKKWRNQLLLPSLRFLSNQAVACSKKAGSAMFTKPCQLIPNAIDVKKYVYSRTDRENVRRKLNLSDEKVVLCVGRLCEQKNVLFAFECFKKLWEKDRNARLIWAGDGELHQIAADWIRNNGMQEKMILLGDCSDVNPYYSAADLFFLPSLFEGLPLTALEAQSSGLPCLLSSEITDEVVCLETVRQMSLSADPEEWAQTLKLLLNTDADRLKQNIIMQRSIFSLNVSHQFLPKLYQEYLRG